MLHQLVLKNFKPFSRPETAPLAPITLVFGPNSSGKSSLMQALLMLKQTADAGDATDTLVTRGDTVDLGSFRSLLNHHDLEKELAIAVSLSGPRSGADRFRVETAFEAFLAEDGRRRDQAILKGVTYRLEGGRQPVSVSLKRAAPRADLPSEYADHLKGLAFAWEDPEALTGLAHHLARVLGGAAEPEAAYVQEILADLREAAVYRKGLLPTRLAHAGARPADPQKRLDYEEYGAFFADVAEDFYQVLAGISYLGPLRSYPERFYMVNDATRKSIGKQGEHVAAFILRRGEVVLEQINRWFRQFEIPYELTIQSIGNEITGEIITLSLLDRRTGVVVSPSDVGFGIGQLLPIIVEGASATGRVLCVEQPEIHLHPRLQAHVADFLIETAGLSGDVPADVRNQWIIETHSESLMLRIQKRIRQGQIRPEDVSVLYVSSAGELGSRIQQLRLDESGEFIDEWPDGFFEESFHELFGR